MCIKRRSFISKSCEAHLNFLKTDQIFILCRLLLCPFITLYMFKHEGEAGSKNRISSIIRWRNAKRVYWAKLKMMPKDKIHWIYKFTRWLLTAGCYSQMAQKFKRKINDHNIFWIGKEKGEVIWLFLVNITGTSLIWQQNHPFQERCAKKNFVHCKWFSVNPFIILSMWNWNVLFILNHFSNVNLLYSATFT